MLDKLLGEDGGHPGDLLALQLHDPEAHSSEVPESHRLRSDQTKIRALLGRVIEGLTEMLRWVQENDHSGAVVCQHAEPEGKRWQLLKCQIVLTVEFYINTHTII